MNAKLLAAALAKKGRFGDTELVHVNPQEKAMLKAAGGAGTINPETGLKEYHFLGGFGRAFGLDGWRDLYNPWRNFNDTRLSPVSYTAAPIVGGILGGIYGGPAGAAAGSAAGSALSGHTAREAITSGALAGIGGAIGGVGSAGSGAADAGSAAADAGTQSATDAAANSLSGANGVGGELFDSAATSSLGNGIGGQFVGDFAKNAAADAASESAKNRLYSKLLAAGLKAGGQSLQQQPIQQFAPPPVFDAPRPIQPQQQQANPYTSLIYGYNPNG